VIDVRPNALQRRNLEGYGRTARDTGLYTGRLWFFHQLSCAATMPNMIMGGGISIGHGRSKAKREQNRGHYFALHQPLPKIQ